MKPRSIGIVGGAGPLAGIALTEQVLKLAGTLYGCHQDADFPQVFLLSFPFSDMLSSKINEVHLKKELKGCLEQLRKNGASVLAIACNTLHAFLDKKENTSDLIHLPRTVAAAVSPSEIPMVLCTATSVKFGIHRKFFPCTYPDHKTQAQIDQIINVTLKGVGPQNNVVQDLCNIIERQKENTIILGCTELSLFSSQLTQSTKTILDPLVLSAEKILERSFSK